MGIYTDNNEPYRNLLNAQLNIQNQNLNTTLQINNQLKEPKSFIEQIKKYKYSIIITIVITI